MYGLDLATLKVGDEVAIARCGRWSIHSEGVYTVTKVNKMVVVVQRGAIARTFSVKRRVEKSKGSSYYSSAWLEAIEDLQSRETVYAAARNRDAAWKAAEDAARGKDLAALKDTVAKLESCVYNTHSETQRSK